MFFSARKILLCLLMVGLAESVTATLSVTVQSVKGPQLNAQGISLQQQAVSDGWDVTVRRLVYEDMRLDQVSARCQWVPVDAAAKVSCEESSVTVQTPFSPALLHLQQNFSITLADQLRATAIGFITADELQLPYSFSSQGAGWDLDLRVDDLDLRSLARLLERPPTWYDWLQSSGLSGSLKVAPVASGMEFEFAGRLKQLNFDSPDGLYAAADLTAQLSAKGVYQDKRLVFSSSGRLHGGELLVQDFYTDWSGKQPEFSIDGQVSADMLDLQRVHFNDPGVLSVTASTILTIAQTAALRQFDLHQVAMQLPQSYEAYLENWLAERDIRDLSTSGQVKGSLSWAENNSVSGQVTLNNVTLKDGGGRFDVDGLSADILIDPKQPRRSSVTWEQAAVYGIPIAAVSLPLTFGSDYFLLREPVRLGVLGGSIGIEELRIDKPFAKNQEVVFKGHLDGLSMPMLSDKLGWPTLGGQLSGSIPSVNWQSGVLSIAGELVFEVFSGQLIVNNLSAERPFGVLPLLRGDIDIREVDLEQVTGAFSFGKITGEMSGYIRGLRVLNWQPVAFDAWLHTTEGSSKKKRISQRAVSNISSIGSGPSVAAVSSPVLRLFEEFNYRRLGIGCKLHRNICTMRGIKTDQPGAYTLVQGRGVPRIQVKGYNRSVDWPQLVAELKAATQGDGAQLGKPE